VKGDGSRPGLIVAIDVNDLAQAQELARALSPIVDGLKVGSTLFSAHGPEALLEVGQHGRVFCDLKFHDIPSQVEGAVRALAEQHVWMLTVHAAGGVPMMKAAAAAAGEATTVAAVTVLTSLSTENGEHRVESLAGSAIEAGLETVVCSPKEIAALKERFGDSLRLVVPGIRPSGATSGDQARVASPAEAARLGADYVVVGRPIVEAPDPAAAAISILEEMQSAV